MVLSTIIVPLFHHLPITVVIMDIELSELTLFDALKEGYGIVLHQLAKVLHWFCSTYTSHVLGLHRFQILLIL